MPSLRLNTRLFVVFVLAVLATGCSRDPKLRRARLIESGQRYMEKSQYESASIQFRRAVQIDSRSADAHYHLASALAKMGSWQEAYRELRATTEIDPKNIPAHLDTAEFLLAGRQTAAARDEINQVLDLDQ